MKSKLKILILALSVAAAGACGDGNQDSSLRANAEGVSEFQANILNEGELTFSGYEKAMLATTECIREGGHKVADLELLDETFYAFSVEGSGPEVDAIVGTCEAEFSGEIQKVWANQNAAEPENESAFYQSVADCLRENGMEISDSSPGALAAAQATDEALYLSCFDAALTS